MPAPSWPLIVAGGAVVGVLAAKLGGGGGASSPVSAPVAGFEPVPAPEPILEPVIVHTPEPGGDVGSRLDALLELLMLREFGGDGEGGDAGGLPAVPQDPTSTPARHSAPPASFWATDPSVRPPGDVPGLRWTGHQWVNAWGNAVDRYGGSNVWLPGGETRYMLNGREVPDPSIRPMEYQRATGYRW